MCVSKCNEQRLGSMNQKTHLVNHIRKDPANLENNNLRWVMVKKDGEEYFSSYFTEAKNRKQAVRTAKKLLLKEIA